MAAHRVSLYYAWNRPEEVSAPLEVIEGRFPALFESRRMLYPRFEEFSNPTRFDQGIAGFLDHIMKSNFTAFVEQVSAQTSQPVIELERVNAEGSRMPLADDWLRGLNTLIVIGFDSLRTTQQVDDAELLAVRSFLAKPGRLLIVSPHHDIAAAGVLSDLDRLRLQQTYFLHHGDRTIPPQQGFGNFARSLLAGLRVPVENRFGLRPASEPNGLPAAIQSENKLDRLGLLEGVTTFNLHPHLPHFERIADASKKMDVLVRQRIDLAAPPHPFSSGGRSTFDALLQSRPGVFAGDLVVCDATLWSSTAGGLDSLRRLWTNVALRQLPP